MNGTLKKYYEFDTFRLDPGERAFFRNGEAVPLSPKVFDLLVFMVENNRHTITKAEFLDRVWADSIVEENSLNRNISILRRVLSDPRNNGNYIKTIPKTGYRFEAEVRRVIEEEEELVVEKRTNYNLTFRSQTSASPPYPKPRNLLVSAVIAGIVVIASMVAWAFWNQSGPAPARNEEAFRLYQRGRALWQDRSAAGLHEATLLLEQAVEKDPGYALAHAALADAYAFDTRNWKKAEAAAARAIELDPKLGEPHAAIGFVKLFWEWRTAEAKKHFRRAIALSPQYATGHQWFALSMAVTGRFNEALAEMEAALKLEPGSPAITADMGQMSYFLRRYDEAEAYCKKALELDARSFNARSCLYQVYTAKGQYSQAVEEFIEREKLAVNNASIPSDLQELRTVYERGGIRAFWREQIRQRKRHASNRGYIIGWCHALLGEKDEALANLHHAYTTHEFDFILFFADPVFRQFSDDRRFQELAAHIIEQEG